MITEPIEVNPKIIKLLRKKLLNASQEEFAFLLAKTGMDVSRWERGVSKPREITKERITRLFRVAAALSSGYSPRAALKWLKTSHKELDGFPPYDLLGSQFATNQLFKLIDSLQDGAYI